MHFIKTAAGVLAACAGVAMGQATLEKPVGMDVPYAWSSGVHDHAGEGFERVADTLVEVRDAAWLRVYFSHVRLDGESFVRLTSLKDGESQDLNALDVQMWSDSSAYFNGGMVAIELFAGPGTRGNSLSIGRLALEMGIREAGDPGQCGICGADDRAPSGESWTCRMMPVGCTASVYCRTSAMITAGHCMGGGAQVVHFNVPASQANCNTVAPPVADQFPILPGGQSLNGGVGADWGVFNVGTNNLGQTPYHRYNVLKPMATAPAVVGNAASFNGFGVDTNCVRSQTQQLSTGNITARNASSYQFGADVRGGNSGSGLVGPLNSLIGVVTHCTSNCPPNYGTRHDVAAFAAARTAVAPACNGVLRLADIQTTGVSGVGIVVSTADANNLQNGLSNFKRVYADGASVTFTAPAGGGGTCFQRWVLNGAPLAVNPVTVSMSQDHVLVAEYGSCGPSNDACGAAIDVSAGGQYSGTLVGATNDGTASCGSSATNPDVWYVFTAGAGCGSRLTVSTCGTNDAGGVDTGIDTVLAMFSPGAGACVGAQRTCNDDSVACGSLDTGLIRDSFLSRDLAPGESVRIRVSKFSTGPVGPFTLNVRFGPVNDACADATPVSDGAVAFNTCAATTDGPTESGCSFCCGDLQVNGDLWYRYTAPVTGTVDVNTCASTAPTFDTKLAVYAGPACPGGPNSAIACNDDAGAGCGPSTLLSRTTFSSVAGQEYLIRVGGFQTSRGQGVLTIQSTGSCDADINCDGSADQGDVACMILAVAGNLSCICQDPDFNQDGSADQGDVASVIQVVAGQPCP